MAFTQNDGPGITASQALRRLVEGNRRFVRGEARFPTVQKKILIELAEQRPYAAILGCSDSRVRGLPFVPASAVVRHSGCRKRCRTKSPSLQYAGVHLKTPLFLVLGHEGCGAVSAAVDVHFHKVRHRSRITKLVSKIIPAIEQVRAELPPGGCCRRASKYVRWTVKQIRNSPEGRVRVGEGRMKLVGAIYEIGTGRVRLLT
jgi:carbonic anhydrase